ncbi:MAG: hypothetical protein DRJ31_06705 [Candidatus Methanomethylicota archaeon]|uniref:NADH:ubiquinone oxidoreductase-like 20kDa subunit domain-containing protein n=1 Tax=Thermoproteota archaeon TaxID=2056631 RepID=A0A497END5_9CREN|nr:MAG: hypothetical protein DRJ31_06705 [Candidatus Verstraetearchaeota archaeon]RLE53672.1 MAG: hypothetical protein DRJ33_00445 [Candidatus Verstraetearchaeota archaeon]
MSFPIGRVILGPVELVLRKVFDWSRHYSLWPAHFVTGCCSPEFMQTAGPRYDMERFGVLPLASVRQSDVLMVVGLVTKKMAKRIKLLYDQMPEPKYVMAIGACPISKGPFRESYSIVSLDEVVPVDVYVPGCPPRPEAILHGVMLLQRLVLEGR